MERKILHIDMDAFYAAVEERDFPRLRNLPVAVGGSPAQRGVVATCNYEARKFGVHSAMSSSKALRLCPELILVKPRFRVYREVSGEIFNIFRACTDLVEPLSLDEAYLDVTAVTHRRNCSATELAVRIKSRIKDGTGLTASAGVSYNKFLAKIASGVNKPDGLYAIKPDQAEAFIAKLPIGRFHGVGRATEMRMKKLGIETGEHLRHQSLQTLTREFGKVGRYYYHVARGIDRREVVPVRIRKSISSEKTFASDIRDVSQMLHELCRRAGEVAAFLVEKKLTGRTVTIKVKFADFSLVTRSRTLERPLLGLRDLQKQLPGLLEKTDAARKSVRLLGVAVSGLCDSKTGRTIKQLDLFV